MKKLFLFLGVLGLGLILMPSSYANMSYDPDCIPSPTHMCANENTESTSQNTSDTSCPAGTVDCLNPVPNTNTINTNTTTTDNETNTTTTQGEAILYINYESTFGHKIYAQGEYQGKHGEVVDLSRFKKELATFEFDHYKPADGKVTLIGGKRLNGTLLYRKRTVPINDSSYTPKTENTQATPTSTTTSSLETPKAKMISGLFDEYFKKSSLNLTQKKAFLMGLKESFKIAQQKLTTNEKKLYDESYSLIISVLENYNF